ncbi:MAG: ABC transporter ATP-binding protein [Spirochaetales bacterium]|mgnify:CR=1 FL=1|jgi:ABC-2 type transport system ATP-binding protein|nr:ABC transporter ATP-binding protein [Spirochaetales bacterium]
MSVIEVHELTKYYGKTKAVDGISFAIDEGEIFGFLGPNGAGKSTTIRCMMDFIRPQQGSVGILGKDAQKNSVELKKDIGYLAGNVRLYGKWTGKEHIEYFHKLNGGMEYAEVLSRQLDYNSAMPVKQLSSGNKQKLGIILAFMSRPSVLILDEPTLGLDPLLQNSVYSLLAEATGNGATVFMSSHNLGEVDRVCSRVGIIRLGKMVATENIAALKKKKISTMYVEFAEKIDTGRLLDDNSELVREDQHALTLKIKGDINRLIKQLGSHTITDIRITQASLEDIFMEYYEKE